ncbi:MAG TPA: CapA family protein [Miltoncostaeaceae bacterium]|nr:CapA family protein [Miltoncostaeaceae bacterium]
MATADDPRARRREEQRRRIKRRRLTALAVLVAVMAVAVVAAVALSGGDSDSGTSGAPAADAEPAPSGQDAAAAAAAPPVDGAEPVTVAAVGDTVMGSLPYGLPPDGGASFFDEVDRLLVGDVVLGNLEGTLATGGASKCGSGSSNCFAFRTPPSYARWLKQAGFTVMNLANNHAYDFGAQAQRETVAALTRAGVRNTGRPGTMAIQQVGGQKVAILGFAPYEWANSLTDIPKARKMVQDAARKAQIVIVTMHAGAEGSDRTHVPSGTETFLGENRGNSRAFTHAAIDAGADLVIGHGPHVLRGMELYKGRLIAYSLGNFGGYEVFGLNATTATSMVLQVTLALDGRLQRARIRPTELVGNGTPAPGGSAISLVSELSREDFGARAPRIGAAGVIRPSSG